MEIPINNEEKTSRDRIRNEVRKKQFEFRIC